MPLRLHPFLQCSLPAYSFLHIEQAKSSMFSLDTTVKFARNPETVPMPPKISYFSDNRVWAKFVSVTKCQRNWFSFRSMLVPVLAFAIRMDAQNACISVPRSTDGIQIDIAPPGRFVDVCAQDKALCRLLTAGYPPTTSTLAYLVLPAEWSAHEKNRANPPHFTRYLIAQHAGSLSPDGLPGLKEHLHANDGQIPDHTQLPTVFASQGRVPLGIIDESPNSISFGIVMRVNVPGDPSAGQMVLASINSAIVIKKQMLSLYAFDTINDPTLVEPIKHLSREWLSCLRHGN